MDFEITNEEEAESMVNGIRYDLFHLDRKTTEDKLQSLKDIQNTITDLVNYYKWKEKKMATTARAHSIQMMMWTRHNFNALHLYCRLRDLGLKKTHAEWLTRVIEPLVRFVIY